MMMPLRGTLGTLGVGRGGAKKVFRLTCTTTGAATLTLQSLGIVAGETVIVEWGDGNSNTYSGTATRTHAYAGAGTWTVTLKTPQHIRILDLRDTKLSGTINSANPMPTSLTTLYLNSLPNVTVGAGEIGGLTSLTYLFLNSLPNVAIQTEYHAAIRTIVYENNLTQANELAIMTSIHANRMSYTYTAITLDIAGGGNASPDGIYADEDPPVTTRGFIYEMVNDPEAEGFKKWAITYTP